MSNPTDKLSGLRIDRDDRESRAPRRGLVALTLLLLAAAAVFGWWYLKPRAARVETVTVTLERSAGPNATATVLDASGYVVARLRATVSSKITGKLREMLVEEGTEVTKGQVLARLDDSIQRRELSLAEARLGAARERLRETEVRIREAELELGRSRSLVESGVVGQAQLDRDQAELDSLRARLEVGREEISVEEQQVSLRRQALEDTVIRAPFDGVTVTKDAQPGEMISPMSAGGGFTRTGLCTLVDMSSLEIEVDVNEAYINRVVDDQPVEAILDAYPGWRIPARVITTVPTADRQRATVRVRIAFEALDPRLLPEMGVKVAFLESAVPEAADEDRPAPKLTMDQRAIRRQGDDTYVFRYDNDVARRAAVLLGPVQEGRVEVLSGLEDGARVIVGGPGDLQDGDAVRIESR